MKWSDIPGSGRAWLMDKLQRLLEDDDTSQPEEAIIRAAMDVLEEGAP